MSNNYNTLIETVNKLLDLSGLSEFTVDEISLNDNSPADENRTNTRTNAKRGKKKENCVIRYNPKTKKYEKVCS